MRGLACLKKSQVLIYDRLVDRRLLRHVPPEVERIYAGKRPGGHTMSQGAINALLVQKAREGLVIARLKGGDPFVFGRGGEEAEALAEAGIPFEIVPGITSAVAAPAYAGIPVTHRGRSSSFAVVTGHEDPLKETSDLNWEKLSTATGTLCFLMGMGNLPLIAEELMRHGRDPQTPVALIRNGTRALQETLTGTLEDVARKAEGAGFKPPAVILVGEVVALRQKLRWFERRPLFGRRIVVTRAREQAGELSALLEERGAEVVEFPTIKIAPPPSYVPLDRAIDRLQEYEWLVFTSINGVESFFRRLQNSGRDVRSLAGLKICAIGPRTEKGLSSRGIQVDLVPEEYRAEAIIEGFREQVKGNEKVLIPRAREAREILPRELRQMGLGVEVVDAYQALREEEDSRELRRMLFSSGVDAVTFTSSSTVKNFIEMLGESDPAGAMQGVLTACIGPVTADTAREMGLPVGAVAEEYTIEGLVCALMEKLGRKSGEADDGF